MLIVWGKSFEIWFIGVQSSVSQPTKYMDIGHTT